MGGVRLPSSAYAWFRRIERQRCAAAAASPPRATGCRRSRARCPQAPGSSQPVHAKVRARRAWDGRRRRRPRGRDVVEGVLRVAGEAEGGIGDAEAQHVPRASWRSRCPRCTSTPVVIALERLRVQVVVVGDDDELRARPRGRPRSPRPACRRRRRAWCGRGRRRHPRRQRRRHGALAADAAPAGARDVDPGSSCDGRTATASAQAATDRPPSAWRCTADADSGERAHRSVGLRSARRASPRGTPATTDAGERSVVASALRRKPRSASALSVRSQVNSASLRPKWP